MHRAREVFVVAVVAGIVHCGGRSSSDPEVGAVADGGTDVTERDDASDAGGSDDGSVANAEDAGNGCPPDRAPPGSACTTEGKSCSYCHTEPGSGSMLGTFCSQEICKGGTWQLVPRTCFCPADPPPPNTFCYGDTIGCSCAYGGCGASRRTFTCRIPGLPPASWGEDMPAVPCNDAGM